MKLRLSALVVIGLFGLGLVACDPAGSIWVDDDGLVALNNCNSTDPGPATIQAGIDAAANGAIVRVCPGTYTDDVNVNKPVKLFGAKQGVDARSRTITPANESKVTGTGATAGRMQVTVSDVTVDGFLFEGNDTAALYTSPAVDGVSIVNNVFRANTFGLYLHGNGDDSEISVQQNLFASNNGPAGSAAGNGIYTDQGLNTADISFNKFQRNDNGAILLARATDGPIVSNVTITNNTSTDDASFVAAFGTHSNLTIRDNTVDDTDANDNANQGSQIFVGDAGTGSPVGVLIQNNTLSNGPANGIAVRGSASNIDVLSNTITNATGAGIDVTSDASGAASEVRGNTSDNNVERGIHFGSATRGTYVTANHATGNGTTDCADDSTGRQRAGVKNIWRTDNIGDTSTPLGLCHS